MGRADSSQASGPGETGDLMREVAAKLAARGLNFSYTGGAPGYLTMTDADGTRCDLDVTDWGHVEWECSLPHPGQIDPKQVADLVTVLLTSQLTGFPRQGDGYGKQLTLKGVVGRELAARGLDVTLDVYEDEECYDVAADIVAANPAARAECLVWVSDGGVITWRSDYSERAATDADVARDIADTIAHAYSCAAPHAGSS
jgi:hypothetical protein